MTMNDPAARDFRTRRPLPQQRHVTEKAVIILAAIALGAVIGWRLGR